MGRNISSDSCNGSQTSDDKKVQSHDFFVSVIFTVRKMRKLTKGSVDVLLPVNQRRRAAEMTPIRRILQIHSMQATAIDLKQTLITICFTKLAIQSKTGIKLLKQLNLYQVKLIIQ